MDGLRCGRALRLTAWAAFVRPGVWLSRKLPSVKAGLSMINTIGPGREKKRPFHAKKLHFRKNIVRICKSENEQDAEREYVGRYIDSAIRKPVMAPAGLSLNGASWTYPFVFRKEAFDRR